MTMQINGTSGLVFNDNSSQNTAASGFGFKNRILNGNMVLDQRNAGASVTPANAQYSVDRWQAWISTSSKFTAQQNAGSVTPPTGFTNYLGMTSSSAYSVGSSDFFAMRQPIEGFNTADLAWGTANAQTVTLSFWVRSSLTGTFGGTLLNQDGSRCYPFSYTISAANTWEQKSITITGSTNGTWNTGNSTGIYVTFGLGVGSTYSGTAGAWASSLVIAPTGATSVVGTSGATFYITGVQLEKGSTATSFDYRPYGTELLLCQRYCQAIGNGLSGISAASNNVWFNPSLSPQMRASPTASLLSAAITVSDNYAADWTSSGSTVGTNNLSYDGGRINILGFSSLVTGRWYGAYGNTNSFLLLSAEL